MNFSDEKYNLILEDILNNKIKGSHDIIDCFYELINGVSLDTLNNLVKEIMKVNPNLKMEESYLLTQDKETSKGTKEDILNLAYNLIDNNQGISTHINQYGYNISSWITHSMIEARVCMMLAERCSLDKEKAFKMGLLHDYGRKYTQTFSHTIIGFEKLVDDGFYDEAVGALTHSFLNGNYFACYNPSKSYIVDDNLKPIPVSNEVINNDMYRFLKRYSYTSYDRILNLADLMATSSEITSPDERIIDIEKRRKMEGRQKEFYINELLKTINWCLEKMGYSECDNFSDASNKIYEILMDSKVKTYRK